MKKIVYLLICSLPILILAACGGGGGSDPAPNPGPPPNVLAVSPDDGAMGVITTTPIKVTFDRAMNPASVTASTPTSAGTFTVSYVVQAVTYDVLGNATTIDQTIIVDGTVAADPGKNNTVFTFTPKVELPRPVEALDPTKPLIGTPTHTTRTFTVTIKGGANGVKEAGGTALTNNKITSFDIWAGTQQLGTLDDDVMTGISVDGDGNSYMAGYTHGSLFGTNINEDVAADIIVAKYDADGTPVWNLPKGGVQFGSPGGFIDKAFGSTLDNNGDVVVVGFTDGTFPALSQPSPVENNPDPAGNTHNYLVMKVNGADGTLKWITQAGAGSGGPDPANPSFVSSFARAVATDANGFIYVAGETNGNLRNGASQSSFTSNYHGGADAFVAKYNPNGTLLWTTLIGTAGDDTASGIAVDGSGNVYVAGTTSGSLGGANAGPDAKGITNDIFVARLNANGQVGLIGQYGTPGDDHANAISLDTFGNVYVVGGTYGSLFGTNADNTVTAGTTTDAFVIKLAAFTLNRVWARQFGTTTHDDAFSVTTDPLGNVFVTGTTYGNLDGNTSAGGPDAFLVKYDSAGNRLWTKQLGSGQTDMGLGVAEVSSTGILYLTGTTQGDLDGNFNMDRAFASTDFFLVKYDAKTGLKY